MGHLSQTIHNTGAAPGQQTASGVDIYPLKVPCHAEQLDAEVQVFCFAVASCPALLHAVCKVCRPLQHRV